MSTSANSIIAILNPAGCRKQRRREVLADEITELCGYINAATQSARTARNFGLIGAD